MIAGFIGNVLKVAIHKRLNSLLGEIECPCMESRIGRNMCSSWRRVCPSPCHYLRRIEDLLLNR